MTNQVISGRGVSVICGTSIYGEVQNASEMMATMNKIDTSSHNNVSSVKTSRPGFIENAEISIDLGYTGHATQDAVQTQFYAGTVSTWMIVAPSSQISRAWSFSGYVSACGIPVFDKDGNAKMTFKVQPTGVITKLSTAVVTGLTALAVTDEGTTALTLSPTFAATTYGYQITTDLADTGVKITATDASANEIIYVNDASQNTGEATATAITIGSAAGSVIMVPVVIMKTGCVPTVYWIEVTHGYV